MMIIDEERSQADLMCHFCSIEGKVVMAKDGVMDQMGTPTQYWNGSDGYAYPVLEWIEWVRLPSIRMDQMECEADRSRNGDNSHNLGTGGRRQANTLEMTLSSTFKAIDAFRSTLPIMMVVAFGAQRFDSLYGYFSSGLAI
nr:hypothetical protein [Tanacetum cinerariifolium]